MTFGLKGPLSELARKLVLLLACRTNFILVAERVTRLRAVHSDPGPLIFTSQKLVEGRLGTSQLAFQFVAMSVAGLRYGPDHGSKAPIETRTGAVLYHGDPASYHDWEFRIMFKLQVLETNEKARLASLHAQLAAEDDGVYAPELDEHGEPIPTMEAPPRSPKKGLSDAAKKEKRLTLNADLEKDPLNFMTKILEGLRGNAFLVARDFGTVEILKPNGLRNLIQRIRESVFPRRPKNFSVLVNYVMEL